MFLYSFCNHQHYFSNDSSLDSIPSNPDDDLMKQQAATHIQRIYLAKKNYKN